MGVNVCSKLLLFNTIVHHITISLKGFFIGHATAALPGLARYVQGYFNILSLLETHD